MDKLEKQIKKEKQMKAETNYALQRYLEEQKKEKQE